METHEESTRTFLRSSSTVNRPSGKVQFSLMITTSQRTSTHNLPDPGRYVIGRSSRADIPINHPEVSRRHCELAVGPGLRVRDLHSHNNTRVGERILPPGDWTEIRYGEVISLGSVTLVIQCGIAGEEKLAPVEALKSGQTIPPTEAIQMTRLPVPNLWMGPWLQQTWPMLSRVAVGEIPILLLGETGVGKEVIAELIHAGSPRANGPLMKLNCAALPENLLESELFGYEKGAFTGAAKTKVGLLESAQGGTVFLDEIGELPMTTQAKLLRFLEDKKFMRLGGLADSTADVRCIAATNRSLELEVERGAFRRDLLYRLNAFTLMIPPLRERTSEIEPLARGFMERAVEIVGKKETPALADEVMAVLRHYGWPGNIRELKNVIERAMLLCGDELLSVEHLPPEIVSASSLNGSDAERNSVNLRRARREAERNEILDALSQTGGNQTHAAKLLGVSRRTLVSRLRLFEIPRPRKPHSNQQP